MRRTHKPFPYGGTTPHTLQGAGAAGGGGGEGLELQDPKLQYLKNLMLKYLGTDEGEAREHMERAIATVLQFSEQVRRRVFSLFLSFCCCCCKTNSSLPQIKSLGWGSTLCYLATLADTVCSCTRMSGLFFSFLLSTYSYTLNTTNSSPEFWVG